MMSKKTEIKTENTLGFSSNRYFIISTTVGKKRILGDVMKEVNYPFFKEEEEEKELRLTERELEVLRLIVLGKSNTEIADELSISIHTAKAHVCSILQKMEVEDRVSAAVKAVRQGLA